MFEVVKLAWKKLLADRGQNSSGTTCTAGPVPHREMTWPSGEGGTALNPAILRNPLRGSFTTPLKSG